MKAILYFILTVIYWVFIIFKKVIAGVYELTQYINDLFQYLFDWLLRE